MRAEPPRSMEISRGLALNHLSEARNDLRILIGDRLKAGRLIAARQQ